MYDWNKLGRVWRDSRRQVLWRSHDDAVNRALVKRWLPPRPIDILLKTDVFDEALGEALLGANVHRCSSGYAPLASSGELD